MTMVQIGEVEILKPRIYPIDPMMVSEPLSTEVMVMPGRYPLFRDGISHFWMMTGRINIGRIYRLGDGIFSASNHDDPGGPEVTFPSPVFGPDEWVAFCAEPTCTEGDTYQRIRIHMFAQKES